MSTIFHVAWSLIPPLPGSRPGGALRGLEVRSLTYSQQNKPSPYPLPLKGRREQKRRHEILR